MLGLLVRLYELHERLVRGDPTAVADVADLTIKPLIGYLSDKRRDADEHAINEAVAEALLGYGEHPGQANANTGKAVFDYLKLAAWRNVTDLQRREVTRAKYEGAYAVEAEHFSQQRERRSVELFVPAAKMLQEGRTGDEGGTPDAGTGTRRVVSADLSPLDLVIVELIQAGERKTEVFAKALGVQHLAPEEQRRVVKRHKDRIKAVLYRERRARSQSAPAGRRGRPSQPRGEETA